MIQQVTSSIYIPNSNIVKFTFDPFDKMWIQQVRYEHKYNETADYGEYIISSVDNKRLLNLTNEIGLGNVKRIIKSNKDKESLFYINIDSINFNGSRERTASVYGVSSDTGYVYRIPHLYIMAEDGSEIVVLDESIDSYLNIIRLIKTKFPKYVENLLIFQNGEYIPFLDSDF